MHRTKRVRQPDSEISPCSVIASVLSQYHLEPIQERSAKLAAELMAALSRHGFEVTPCASKPAPHEDAEDAEKLRWNMVQGRDLNDPAICLTEGQRALERSDMLLACDYLARGVTLVSSETGTSAGEPDLAGALKQKLALAYAEVGMIGRSRELLDDLSPTLSQAPETQGVLGRIFKSMALRTKDPQRQKQLIDKAFNHYHEAYRASGDAYNGINAATLAMFAGHKENAQKIAHRLLKSCELSSHEDPWTNATLGESWLLLGNLEQAEHHYRLANQAMRGEYRNQRSMQRQAEWITHTLGLDTGFIERCFSHINIAVFTGHMVDQDTGLCRFPASKEVEVTHLIREHIQKEEIEIGYCSAAAGADLLFIEQMVALGKEIHIILPYSVPDFERTSVNLYSDRRWVARFTEAISKAASVTVLSDYDERVEGALLEFAALYAHGVARDRASRINGVVKGLALWDGRPSNARGGTFQTLSQWRDTGTPVTHLDISGYAPAEAGTARAQGPVAAIPAGMRHFTFLPMLFADVKNYSKLSDVELTRFSTSFLELIARILSPHLSAILYKRTLGDGLFIVFRELDDAAAVAAKIRDGVADHDWRGEGLPDQISIRLSLDAGPVYAFYDPVEEREGFCSGHINRAARLEPITPPGKVFVSDTFVALCRAFSRPIEAHYVGKVDLAKEYGRVRAYLLK